MSSTKEKLNTFSLTMIVIGFVIGMGIFRTATDAAQASINSTVFFTAWILGGVVALCGALSYAEIGSRYPITGGYYKIFSYAYHPSIAFALNCIILFSNAASLSGVAIIGSEYLLPLIFGDQYPEYYNSVLSISAILSFYGLNMLGLRMSSRTQNILMLIKLSMLLVIIIAVFLPHDSIPIVSKPETIIGNQANFFASLGAALVAVCFTYGGYQQSINFGEEVNKPERTVPRGILIGISAVILIYFLVNYSYHQIIGFEGLKTTKGIASLIAEHVFGENGRKIFSILLFVAVLAYVNVLMLSNPRVMYAMADDGVLPPIFQKKFGTHQVLALNLTVFAILSIITLVFASTFDKILGFVMFLDSVGMVSSAATLFYMRRRRLGEDKEQIYKMGLYPYATVFFILVYLFVCFTIVKNSPHLALFGTIVFIGFFGLYFVIRSFKPKPL
ncbi:MAG: APC family permease [Saprospiraceae bacterium]